MASKKAKDFLKKLSDEQLGELVHCSHLESFPDDHLMRQFVTAAYGEDNETPFLLAMINVFPDIAEEAYERYINK